MTASTELTTEEEDVFRLPGGPSLGVPVAFIDGDDEAWEIHLAKHPEAGLVTARLIETRPMERPRLVMQWAANRPATPRNLLGEASRFLAVARGV